MDGEQPTARRGRRQAPLGAGLPEHRRAFAQALRDLRDECGAPTYRELSRLAHCASGTMSEAAGGQHVPSWETTRAYVTGCLRHAGREADAPAVLLQWRSRWEQTRFWEGIPAINTPAPVRRPGPRWVRHVSVAAVLLLLVTALHRGAAPDPPPMSGTYNIALAAPSATGGELGVRLAERLHRLLAAELDAWADTTPAVQVRTVRIPGDGSARAVARRHGADVVLQPVLRGDARTVTLSVGIEVAGRALGETPEFAGRHDLGTTEPVDVAERNPRVHERLAGSTLHYLEALMAFVRGLGDYTLGDFPAAERSLLTADRMFGEAGAAGARRAVVHLMLGNAVGAQDLGRADEAAAHFRRALAEDPGYARTTLGLADALRVGVRCEPGAPGAGRLREAAGHYERSLAVAGQQPLLAAKAHLGLGLVDQCLSLIGADRRWCSANSHFANALRLTGSVTARGSAEDARQARWLAAEARAGEALHALTWEEYGRAAARYEEALSMLGGIDVVRRSYLERELTFLRGLRLAYDRLGRPTELAATDRRISDTDRQLSAGR